MSSSLLLQQIVACFIHLAWMFYSSCVMGDKRPYSCLIQIECFVQHLLKITQNGVILVFST